MDTAGVGGVAGTAGVGGVAGAAGVAGPCNQLPAVNLTPGQTQPLPAGSTVVFDLSVTNFNSPACPASTYWYRLMVASPLSPTAPAAGQFNPIAAREIAHATIYVASAADAPTGSYSFSATVTGGSLPVTASASYVVESPPPVSTGTALVPDGDGHFDGNNSAGVVGSWWATGDDYSMDNLPGSGTCSADGFPDVDCSVLTSLRNQQPTVPVGGSAGGSSSERDKSGGPMGANKRTERPGVEKREVSVADIVVSCLPKIVDADVATRLTRAVPGHGGSRARTWNGFARRRAAEP